MFVYTVVGAKVNTAKLEERVDEESIRRGYPLMETLESEGLQSIDDNVGSTFVCTRSHAFQEHGGMLLNYGPLVIYQDANWDKDKVRRFLERLELWMPGEFGVWTFAVPKQSEQAAQD